MLCIGISIFNKNGTEKSSCSQPTYHQELHVHATSDSNLPNNITLPSLYQPHDGFALSAVWSFQCYKFSSRDFQQQTFSI